MNTTNGNTTGSTSRSPFGRWPGMIGRMTAPTRRQFLATSAALPLTVGATAARPPRPTADAVIFLLLTGGPSQLDTFDPKPDAPADIRGPFGTIPTRTPGVRVSELFPKLAAVSHHWSLIRSMTSEVPPIHELALRAMTVGAELADRLDSRGEHPDFPRCWQFGADPDFGGGMGTGTPGAITLAEQHRFDIRCQGAARAVQSGARVATVPMFSTVFDAPSWDCHADGGSLSCNLDDYRDTVAPLFDQAVSHLLANLHDRGLLERTLVVATGEFGRSPKPNCNGGRDHWPRCWTTLVAGGGVQGGRVIGRSDSCASEPVDRPVTPADLVATVYHAVGKPSALPSVRPVYELF